MDMKKNNFMFSPQKHVRHGITYVMSIVFPFHPKGAYVDVEVELH
jgi:hypothetical protein